MAKQHDSNRLRRKRRKRAEKRGVALIMVLGAIAVLSVFLTELQEDTSADLSAALAERDVLRAEYAAKSAVNLSRMLIASEPIITQPLAMLRAFVPQIPPQIPVWDYADVLLGPFNDAGAQAAFGSASGLDFSTGKNIGMNGASFRIKVVNEEGMINLNMASGAGTPTAQVRLAAGIMGAFAGPQYDPLFQNRDIDNQFSDRFTICSALLDWTDWDENLVSCDFTGNAPPSGTEDNIYQSIGLPYRRKNAPFDSLDEVRLVRGMGDDVWSTFVDPDPSDPSRRQMTVWGRDKFNPNTATPAVLLAFVCGNVVHPSPLCDMPADSTNPLGSPAAQLMFYLNMARSMLPGLPLVGSAQDFVTAFKTGSGQSVLGLILTAAKIPPVTWQSESQVKNSVDLKSRIFSIYGEGTVKGFFRETHVRVHAVVDMRDAGKPPMLQGAMGDALVNAAMGNTGATGTTGTTPTGFGQPAPGSPESQLRSDPGGTIIYWRIE
jgi:general secretion pathway protein K